MDDADRAQEQIEREQKHAVRFVLAALGYRVELAPGECGECKECGEKSIRLINSKCARCRDQEARDMALKTRTAKCIL